MQHGSLALTSFDVRCQFGLCCCELFIVVAKARFPLPELTARVNGPSWRDGPSTQLVETHARQHGPCWRVMETGHPSTPAVNSGHQLG